MPGPAFVYLLRCADGSLYCGWTYDLDARVAKHRAGTASRYTRSRLPVELAWSAELPDPGGGDARGTARSNGCRRVEKQRLIAH